MNAAFAIGRLCDFEAGCKRMLSLKTSNLMVIKVAVCSSPQLQFSLWFYISSNFPLPINYCWNWNHRMLIMFICITPVSTILLKTDWFLHYEQVEYLATCFWKNYMFLDCYRCMYEFFSNDCFPCVHCKIQRLIISYKYYSTYVDYQIRWDYYTCSFIMLNMSIFPLLFYPVHLEI